MNPETSRRSHKNQGEVAGWKGAEPSRGFHDDKDDSRGNHPERERSLSAIALVDANESLAAAERLAFLFHVFQMMVDVIDCV